MFNANQDVNGIIDRGGEDLADVDTSVDIESRCSKRNPGKMSCHLLQVKE